MGSTIPTTICMDDNYDEYPPELSNPHTLSLMSQIHDWQLNHGSLLKLVQTQTQHSVKAYPVGVSVFPTLFPRALFYHALGLQTIFNELYCAVAEDEEWLASVTHDLRALEPLAAALWDIYDEVKKDRTAQNIDDGKVSAGIFRSDYMLHMAMPEDVAVCENHTTNSTINLENDQHERSDITRSTIRRTSLDFHNGNGNCGGIPIQLKQVEFNTYSCAGGVHAKKVVDMHWYLAMTGAYDQGVDSNDDRLRSSPIKLSALPQNDNIQSLAACLAAAHAAYGPPKSEQATQTAVLFIVQPDNYNIADERPIEYALWQRDPQVQVIRLDFGVDVLARTRLVDKSRELLLFQDKAASSNHGGFPVEISVIYMRAGYDVEEYDHIGHAARLQLEKSRAIKCPSLLSHISTFKKVQQALAAPGGLERFLSPEKAARIRATFVPLYPLDDKSDAGREARRLANDRRTAVNYILKPSLEGGGHNIYGADIPHFLNSIPSSRWDAYILMQRIQPPMLWNVLMSVHGICANQVVSELGVFGTCLWKRNATTNRDGHPLYELLQNLVGGWSFKTKDAMVDEMSVVKGYGCFDTPCLVDF